MRSAAEGFPSGNRLRRSREFQRVSREGRRRASRGFVMLVASPPEEAQERSPAPPARLGVTVSRRVGNAVVRNRTKRRIREWFRRGSARGQAGDIVVIARSGAGRLEAAEVASELDALWRGLEEGRR